MNKKASSDFSESRFLITSEIFSGPFSIGHHVSQGAISYFPRQPSLTTAGASGSPLVHTASHVVICPLGTPDRWPPGLCTDLLMFGEVHNSKLLVMSPES